MACDSAQRPEKGLQQARALLKIARRRRLSLLVKRIVTGVPARLVGVFGLTAINRALDIAPNPWTRTCTKFSTHLSDTTRARPMPNQSRLPVIMTLNGTG